MDSKETCLVCDRKRFVRGLCKPCYQAARRSVKQNKATWEELEHAGLILPAGLGGHSSPFVNALQRALRG